MTKILKYSAIILVSIVALVAVVRLGSCDQAGINNAYVRVPSDSGFAPVIERSFRPRSTPFEGPSKLPGKLPKDVPEGNVARIVAVVKRIPIDSTHFLTDTTSFVLTKDDLLFVQKNSGVQISVEDTKFVDPIFHWDLFTSVGISIAKFGLPTVEVSPSVAISPLEVLGKIQIPFFVADLSGIGIGIGYRHKDYILALAEHERFIDAGRSIRITIHYSI